MKRARSSSSSPDAAAKRARAAPFDTDLFPSEMVREVAAHTADVPSYLALSRVCRAWALVLGDVVSVVEHVLRTAPAVAARLGVMRVVRARDLWPDYRWQQLTRRADASLDEDVLRPLTRDVWPAALRGEPVVAAGGYARAMLLKQCRAAGVARIPAALSEAYADVDAWMPPEHRERTFAVVIGLPPRAPAPIFHINGITSRRDVFGGCFGQVPVQLISHCGHLAHCGHEGFRNLCGSPVAKIMEWPGVEEDASQEHYYCLFGRYGSDTEAPVAPLVAFLRCFDLAAPAVAFNGQDVWLTPLAAYAMLTGRCVVVDHCPLHAPPWRRIYPDGPHHYRVAEWRLLQRAAKYAALGYTIVERGLCCAAAGEAVDPARPLPLLGDVAALVARGRAAVNREAGIFPVETGADEDPGY